MKQKYIVVLGGGESGVGAAILAKQKGYKVFLSDLSAIKPNYLQLLNEHDILTTTGKVLRPDRVMIDGRKATVIDYKFGHEHHNIYQEQLRNYVLLLEQMGYQVEAYIVYVAQYKIEQI